ncbi:MAG TPA: sigma 54-interacting transcriptional regulator [Patescibacteria group bacterium]|nr:sigma 54-interacting transcriptional regulator [Patescibacteria group bacterium]
MIVKEIMSRNIITLSLGDTMQHAVEKMSESGFDSLPVINHKTQLVGLFTKLDLYEAVKEGKPSTMLIDNLVNREIHGILEEEPGSIIFDMPTEKFPVVDRQNRLVGIITKTDMLKAYYGKLQYTMNSLNGVLESTNNGIVAINKDRRITVFNKAAGKILGVDASKVLDQEIASVMPESELPHVLESGESEIGSTLNINGKTLITNRTPIFQGGKVVGAVAVFQDITDYKNAMHELNEERNATFILNMILETIYDGVVLVDKDGYITMLSKAYAEFLGVKREAVIGKHVTEVIENTRMHIVAQTGVPEIAGVQKIRGSQMIATRIPMIKDGKVIGAVGKVLYRNLDELNDLYKRISKMEKELEHYKGEFKRVNKAKYNFDNIKGESKQMQELIGFSLKAAASDSNVLLLGESGTGKELFAHAIHNASKRAFAPFIKVNCAAIPHELLESELFGYESGAFTGAKKEGKIGKFEAANGGTMFLDEIGDMSLQMQAKLLRVLQEKEVERLGANSSEKVDVRIIAATNKNLEGLVAEGKYRLDLFYRLNVLTVSIPALRERKEDIPAIVNSLVDKISSNMEKYIEKVSEKAMEYLKNYEWPGNVRELENVLERAISIIEKDNVIRPEYLPSSITGIHIHKNIGSLEEILMGTERQAILDALMIEKGNKTKAAKLLNVSRTSLYEKMTKHGIQDHF